MFLNGTAVDDLNGKKMRVKNIPDHESGQSSLLIYA
jgi:hypothetical protein